METGIARLRTFHIFAMFPIAFSLSMLTNLSLRIFNTGSPYNVPAGSTVNLDELKAHYQQKNLEAEKKRMARLVATEGDSYDLTQRREAEGAQGG